jgi:hypothetical protein
MERLKQRMASVLIYSIGKALPDSFPLLDKQTRFSEQAKWFRAGDLPEPLSYQPFSAKVRSHVKQ